MTKQENKEIQKVVRDYLKQDDGLLAEVSKRFTKVYSKFYEAERKIKWLQRDQDDALAKLNTIKELMPECLDETKASIIREYESKKYELDNHTEILKRNLTRHLREECNYENQIGDIRVIIELLKSANLQSGDIANVLCEYIKAKGYVNYAKNNEQKTLNINTNKIR